MPSLAVRRYDPGDADAVWELHVRALDDAGAYDEEFTDLRAIDAEYPECGGEFVVGEYENEIVAMGGFQPHDDRTDAAVLRRVRVDPNHQRHGFGTGVLETTAQQTAAMAFYETYGYRAVHRERESAVRRSCTTKRD